MRRVIHRGRFSAAHDGDIVVFLIGMRVNKPWKVRQWWPVFTAMPPMLKELSQDPDSGLLGFRGFFGLRTATLLQYWESMEQLERFAGDPARTHRPAWLRYFRDSYADGAVGFWHETYIVPAGSHETVYGNMPAVGLGAVSGVVPVGQRGESAAARLAGTTSVR
jgi:hypothetical protein